MEFICSCISCNGEVSLCIVSWLCLNFCTLNSSTRSSWALFISPISWKFRIWVSRSTFSFIDNSSCSRAFSLRDSKNPWWESCNSNSNLWAWACCWSSLIPLWRDPTWCSCFTSSDLAWLSKWSLLPSRRDLPNFDGSAYLKIEVSNWSPGSLLLDESTASDLPDALGSWVEHDIKLSPLEWSAWIRCALAPSLLYCLCFWFPWNRGSSRRVNIFSLARVYTVVKPAFS